MFVSYNIMYLHLQILKKPIHLRCLKMMFANLNLKEGLY